MLKKYVPDTSLVTTWDVAEKFEKCPLMVVYEFDNKHLIYVGTKHNSRTNKAKESFDAINYAFANFGIECVVTEVERACKNIDCLYKQDMSELAYSAYVAKRKEIPYIFADTNIADWIQKFDEFSHKRAIQLQTMWILNDARKYKLHFSKPDTVELAFENVKYNLRQMGYDMTLTLLEFEQCCKDDFGCVVSDENVSDILDKLQNWAEPNIKGNITNKLWAEINVYSRTPYMLEKIFKAINKYNTVLVTMGAGHFEEQRLVLEKAFGQPFYIDKFPHSKQIGKI